MTTPLYQVDAFTDRVFHGNPAAVCPLAEWLPETVMQAIAGENNLAETAFFTGSDGSYELRWFTPVAEVDLCGHATLASAFVILRFLDPELQQVVFDTRSGPLTVTRAGSALTMDFPALFAQPTAAPVALIEGLGVLPVEVLASADWLVRLESEAEVRALQPDMTQLRKLDRRGVIVTGPGVEHDFVSRFFAPNYGIPEDPVTGSAHCILAPYWAERLGKTAFRARQVSQRGGDLGVRLDGDRVHLTGQAVLYLRGEIEI